MSAVSDVDAICYRKNFLTRVVARADFAEPQERLQRKVDDSARAIIARRFEISESRSREEREFKLSPATGEVHAGPTEEKIQWFFRSKDGFRRAAISPEYFWIEYNAYDRFESLRSDATLIASAIGDTGAAPRIKRLGLRYINSFELPMVGGTKPNPLAWKGYIHDKLIGCLDFAVETDRWAIARYFSNLTFSLEECRLTLNFGVFNEDFPQPVRRRQFILDIDGSSTDEVEFSNLADKLTASHRQIQTYFERAVGPKLRKLLEPAEEEPFES